MELKIYKGFDVEFLSKLNKDDALIQNDVNDKIDVLLFDKAYIKKLSVALEMLEEEDSKWITYEEYSLIKDKIATNIINYGMKVSLIINNLYADIYPIGFKLSDEIYDELKTNEESEIRRELSEDALKVNKIYSSIIKLDEEYYGTFYNYEYDKTSDLLLVNYYSCDIEELDEKKEAELSIYVNDDLESYLKSIKDLKFIKPKSLSIRETGTRASKRIVNSLHAFCLENEIKLLKYFEELKPEDPIVKELIDIAKNDLKISNFTDFRKIKFYKNPDLNKEVVDISQAQIIKEIIAQAENSYNDANNYNFRDVFITAFTGAGKSVMFQVPAIYLAKKYKKLTIIIEPVIALMEDQKDALIKRGFKRVEAFNSNLISQVERDNVLKRVKDGDIDLLYLSPETLLSYSLSTIIGDREIGLLIVDEAHIVTTWGVGFRPDYWYLGGYINSVRSVIQSGNYKKDKKVQHFPICAFTATAINGGYDDSVNETIISLCMNNPVKYIGYAKRDDIKFNIVIREEDKLGMSEYKKRKGADLVNKIQNWISNNEKTIVYFPYATYARDAFFGNEGFASAKYNKEDVGLYTGRDVTDVSPEVAKLQKQETFDKFREGTIKVMFATKAFGMGVDINDIVNVYHYAVTGNLCDYVQEIGRAARKVGMTGYAITDFYRNDLTFMQRLFGMSQIRQYQINKVLSGIYDVYKNKKERNFLISPQSFTYIFSSSFGDSESINKLKTCLLMLEKDFYDKYSFKVLISRPQSVFTKAFVCVFNDHIDEVLNSKYGSALTFVCKGRKNEPSPSGEITDLGDIYSIDLKTLWEKYYPNLSFPQFKYWYFKSFGGKTDVNVLEEIKTYIHPRQKVTIQVKNNKDFDAVLKAILEDLNYISNALYDNFRGKYFSLEDFSSVISSQFGMTKARIIANSIIDIVDPTHKVIKIRTSDEGTSTVYNISNGTFGFILKKPITNSRLIKSFANNHSSEFSQYILMSTDSIGSDGPKKNVDVDALKILSIFDYISYEIIGGEEPEIFVRLNDPNKVEGIVNGSIKYTNNYVIKAKEKHDRDVKTLYKFFTSLDTDDERWNYIEKYFLGYNVCNDGSTDLNETNIGSFEIIDEHSSPSKPYKDWNSASILFDDSLLSIIKEFGENSVPIPEYFHTKIKGNILSEDPIMSWPDKKVLIFGPDATDGDMAICKSKGWTPFKILELDVKELLKEVI